MAFTKSCWSPGNRANGRFAEHKYDANAAGDAIATVAGANYFNGIQDHIATGDVVLVVATDATKFYRLTNTAGVITLPTAVAFA